MAQNLTFRSRFGVAISGIIWVVLAISTGFVFFQPDPSEFFGLLPVFAFIAILLYWLYWRPRLEFTNDFVHVVNLTRSYRISYGAIANVSTKYTLTIQTIEKDVISVWSAPAPSRYRIQSVAKPETTNLPKSTYLEGTVGSGDIISSESGSAAYVLRQKWEAYVEASEPKAPASISRSISYIWPVIAITMLGIAIWLNS